MSEAAQGSQPMKKAFWATLAFLIAYWLAAVACLRQRGGAHPWLRLDVFSGGYLVLSLLWAAAAMRFHRVIFRSKEIMREAAGATFDPALLPCISLLSLAELTVFVDYARWHLVPALEQPVLQWLGLALYLVGAFWLFWADRYLTQHFSGDPAARQVITQGPYRYVRHPRYAALLASRVAFSLVFASVLAWGFLLGWAVLLVRRIRLEEAHLRAIFGADYDAYVSRTARLLPGIF